MLMNGDVFAHPKIYHRVAFAGGTVLSMDSTSGQDDEHMKVQLQDGRVRGIAKSLPLELVVGAVDVADLPWVEIDFPEDLEHAQEVTLPSIYGSKVRRRA
jgi:choline kinase